MAVNWVGLTSIIVFYLLILLVGLYAAWRRRQLNKDSDEIMLAGRSIGYFMGFMTMTATWVGGGYLNGTAEAMYTSGLFWCQPPIGYTISLIIGGLFYAKKMRQAEYITMLDPLQECFGLKWGSMLYLPALAGEVLWSAAILAALGTTLAVILGINEALSIILSAFIAIFYTLLGGLYSVAYTDVVQLICIAVGLGLSVPYSMMSPHVGSLDLNSTNWVGEVPSTISQWGVWWDYAFLLMFGGIPWQAYFQRVLSAKSPKHAEVLSYAAALGCLLMAIPPIMLGAVAKATDWESTALNSTIEAAGKEKFVLPLVLQNLNPQWVSFVGLGAVSAAVMSSADSAVLSASSMFTHNIYKSVLRPKASSRETGIVLRGIIPIIGAVGCAIAIFTKSIYQLSYLCSDFVYVMLFPQLTLAVHCPNYVNRIGSVSAYVAGFLLRILGGDQVLGIPPVILYPWYDHENEVQHFPFRTLAMLVTFVTLLLVSRLTRGWDTRRKNVAISPETSKCSPVPHDIGHDNIAMEKVF